MINNNHDGYICTTYIMFVPWNPYPDHVRDESDYSGLDIHFTKYEIPEKSLHKHIYDWDDSVCIQFTKVLQKKFTKMFFLTPVYETWCKILYKNYW